MDMKLISAIVCMLVSRPYILPLTIHCKFVLQLHTHDIHHVQKVVESYHSVRVEIYANIAGKINSCTLHQDDHRTSIVLNIL